MRETDTCHGLAILVLAVLTMVVGCKSDEPAAEPPANTEPASKGEAKTEVVDSKPESEVDPKADPERADKLADLDAMCKALDHDYVDGTLTDYYRDIEPRTDWGKAQRDAGNESIKPGRLLEQAVAELSPGAKDPALTNCRKLLDYLDDVE